VNYRTPDNSLVGKEVDFCKKACSKCPLYVKRAVYICRKDIWPEMLIDVSEGEILRHLLEFIAHIQIQEEQDMANASQLRRAKANKLTATQERKQSLKANRVFGQTRTTMPRKSKSR